jgi:PleD family two-component response regulator
VACHHFHRHLLHGPADREAEAAVIRADKALYTAKHAGKDQAIVLAPDEA